MHKEVKDFIQRMKEHHPVMFSEMKRVFEAGSLDINGTPRPYFKGAKYIGLDWRKGPGVDIVSLMHEYQGHKDGSFDLVISTEMLEHDPHWIESVRNMCRLVRKGGSLLITCAGPGRHEHDVETSPEKLYYENVGVVSLVDAIWAGGARFRFMHCEDDVKAKDSRIFCWGKV